MDDDDVPQRCATTGVDVQYLAFAGVAITIGATYLVWSGRVATADGEEREGIAKVSMTIGLLLSAMIPQLCSTFIHGPLATNKIMPSFLIIAVVGLLFKLNAMESKTRLQRCLIATAVIPMLFHYIWLVQVAVYNNADADCPSQARRQLVNKRVAIAFVVLLGICMPAMACAKMHRRRRT